MSRLLCWVFLHEPLDLPLVYPALEWSAIERMRWESWRWDIQHWACLSHMGVHYQALTLLLHSYLVGCPLQLNSLPYISSEKGSKLKRQMIAEMTHHLNPSLAISHDLVCWRVLNPLAFFIPRLKLTHISTDNSDFRLLYQWDMNSVLDLQLPRRNGYFLILAWTSTSIKWEWWYCNAEGTKWHRQWLFFSLLCTILC